MGTEENPKWSSLAEEGQSRLIPAVQISPLSLHTLVFSTLGLNVRWGVRACAWSPCVCECPSTSMSVLLNGCCGPGLGDPGAGHPWSGCWRLSRASKRLPVSLLSEPPRQARPRFSYRWLKAPSGVQLPLPKAGARGSRRPQLPLPRGFHAGSLGCGPPAARSRKQRRRRLPREGHSPGSAASLHVQLPGVRLARQHVSHAALQRGLLP